ncbi:MAG: Mg-chelatase subunit ChlD, partial [Mycobacterium sp.]|nr:Mg-chelatase subunit ChlD [Mycobacterium sp.]
MRTAGVKLPVLGWLTLSGFAHRWYLLFLLAILGLAALYVIMQLSRRKRILRFANMELLGSVAPRRPTRRQHLPAVLLVVALLVLT